MQIRVVAGFCLLAIILMLKGCGNTPQMASSNRKVLEALQTAVSSKKSEWLEAVATQVAEKHEEGDISDNEFNAIDAIVQKAKSGDWKGAQKDSFALSEGQRPTSEDLEMLKDRKRVKEPATK